MPSAVCDSVLDLDVAETQRILNAYVADRISRFPAAVREAVLLKADKSDAALAKAICHKSQGNLLVASSILNQLANGVGFDLSGTPLDLASFFRHTFAALFPLDSSTDSERSAAVENWQTVKAALEVIIAEPTPLTRLKNLVSIRFMRNQLLPSQWRNLQVQGLITEAEDGRIAVYHQYLADWLMSDADFGVDLVLGHRVHLAGLFILTTEPSTVLAEQCCTLTNNHIDQKSFSAVTAGIARLSGIPEACFSSLVRHISGGEASEALLDSLMSSCRLLKLCKRNQLAQCPILAGSFLKANGHGDGLIGLFKEVIVVGDTVRFKEIWDVTERRGLLNVAVVGPVVSMANNYGRLEISQMALVWFDQHLRKEPNDFLKRQISQYSKDVVFEAAGRGLASWLKRHHEFGFASADVDLGDNTLLHRLVSSPRNLAKQHFDNFAECYSIIANDIKCNIFATNKSGDTAVLIGARTKADGTEKAVLYLCKAAEQQAHQIGMDPTKLLNFWNAANPVDGRTLLHQASSSGFADLATFLVERKANIAAVSLQEALCNGHADLALSLLQQRPDLLDETIRLAWESESRLQMVSHLLEGPFLEWLSSRTFDINFSFAYCAVACGKSAEFLRLLQRQPHLVKAHGRDYLRAACCPGNSELLQFLVQQGAAVVSDDIHNLLASRRFDKEAVMVLLHALPDFFDNRRLQMYLGYAVGYESDEFLKFLVERRADVAAPVDEKSPLRTPLQIALDNKHYYFAASLIRELKTLPVAPPGAASMLHFACAAQGVGVDRLVESLIKVKAGLETPDALGRTPIIVAITNRNHDAALKLLEAGANSAVRDVENNTLLHLAAAHLDSSSAVMVIASLVKTYGMQSLLDAKNKTDLIPEQMTSNGFVKHKIQQLRCRCVYFLLTSLFGFCRASGMSSRS